MLPHSPMWAVSWGRRSPSQGSCGTWTERSWRSSLEVKQPEHREPAQLQECARESHGWYPPLPQGSCRCLSGWWGEHQASSKGTASPLPETGIMVWHSTILAKSLPVSQQRSLELYEPAFLYQYSAQLWLIVWSVTRGSFLFSPQEISVVQEDLQDSEGFYELRSMLMLQGAHETHKTFSCMCLFPFLGNETRNISSEEIFVSFGRFS